jgi:hypothetical protein
MVVVHFYYPWIQDPKPLPDNTVPVPFFLQNSKLFPDRKTKFVDQQFFGSSFILCGSGSRPGSTYPRNGSARIKNITVRRGPYKS